MKRSMMDILGQRAVELLDVSPDMISPALGRLAQGERIRADTVNQNLPNISTKLFAPTVDLAVNTIGACELTIQTMKSAVGLKHDPLQRRDHRWMTTDQESPM